MPEVPDIFVQGGARGYVVSHPFFWAIGKKGSEWVLAVPAGFEFESSVPRFLRWFLSPDDPHFLMAAAIHDRLLETGHRTRFADGEWLDAARSEHAPAIKREAAYSAMRLRRFLIWLFARCEA